MKNLKKWITRFALLLAFLISWCCFINICGQDDGFSDEIRKLLDAGLQAYNKGDYDTALVKLETALNKQPGSDLIFAFYKRAGEEKILKMLNSPDERLRNTAQRIFLLAGPRIGELKEYLKNINEYIEALKSDDVAKRKYALYHIKNIGPHAVKYLLPALGDEKELTFRSTIILTLVEMGMDASNALIEALDSKSDLMRKNAAVTLGHIGDERAIPALKKLYENPNENLDIKKEVNESLQKITKKTMDELRTAKEYYFELAEKYYYSVPSVIPTFQYTYLIWKWKVDVDKLTQREVPSFAYGNQLAEEACFDALELDPNYERVWPLLISIYIAQYLQGREALEIAEKRRNEGEIETVMYDDLKKKLSDLKQFNVLSNMTGRKYLYQALTRALEDGKVLVARACINLIRELGKYDELPPLPQGIKSEEEIKKLSEIKISDEDKKKYFGYPLIDALAYDDKMVRYTAANAMVHMNPLDKRLGMGLVIPHIIKALGEESVHTALVIYDQPIEDDRAFINKFRKTLFSLNVFPIIATSGNEGLIRAKGFPSVDVIFLRSKIANQVYFTEEATKKPVVETIFDALKADIRTKTIPIYLICRTEKDSDANRGIYTDKVDTYMTIDFNKLDLQNWLNTTFYQEEVKTKSKERADELARIAAEAIAEITPTNTLYPYRDTIPALIKTLDPQILRRDFIRLPCIKALGKFGDVQAFDILAKLLNDRTNTREIRLACAKSISEIFRQTHTIPTQDIFDILKNNLNDSEFEIQVAVSEALGNSKLTNEQRLELEKLKRMKYEVEE